MRSFDGPFRCVLSSTSIKLRGSDIRYSLSSGERGWLRRRAFAVAFGHKAAALLGASSVLCLVLLPITEVIARTLGLQQTTLMTTFLALAASMLLLAGVMWCSAYRWALPGLLLQIDRCGCCGNALGSRRKANNAFPTANLSARCSECGAEWSPGIRVGFIESSLEHLCEKA